VLAECDVPPGCGSVTSALVGSAFNVPGTVAHQKIYTINRHAFASIQKQA